MMMCGSLGANDCDHMLFELVKKTQGVERTSQVVVALPSQGIQLDMG